MKIYTLLILLILSSFLNVKAQTISRQPESSPMGYIYSRGGIYPDSVLKAPNVKKVYHGINAPDSAGNLAVVDGILLYFDGNHWAPVDTGATAGTGTVTAVTAGAGLAASPNPIISTGTISMPNVGTPGTYGDSAHTLKITTDAQGRVSVIQVFSITPGGGGGSGTVTSFSAGTLSPLFATSVATATTTPALSFSLSNAGSHTFFGNFTGSTGAPSYGNPSLTSADFANQGTTTTVYHGNAAGNPSFGQIVTADIATNAVTYAKIQSGSTNSLLLGTPSSGAAYQEITLGSGLSMSSGVLSSTGTGGTVTSVSLGNLSPLFTTTGNPITTSGTISFSLSTAGANTLFGNNTGSTASPVYFNPTLTGLPFGSEGTTTQLLHGNAGGLFSFGQLVTGDISASAVTYAKLQSETASTLLGNPTGGGAVPSEITLGSGLSFSGTTLVSTGAGGTVTSVSAGNLSPLFTTSGTPITGSGTISFSLTNAAAHTFFGNFTGSAGAPSYGSPTLASADFINQGTTTTVLHGNAAGNPSFGQVVTGDIANNVITYAKIQAGSTNSLLLGTPSGGNAYQEITLGTGLSMSSGVLSSTGGGGGSPGGTAGAVQYNYNNASFGGNATRFVWDSIYKRLGVGSSTPSQTLGVSTIIQSIIVTGTMSPDVTGTYIYAGQHNGYNYYTSANGVIWRQAGAGAWFISPALDNRDFDWYDLSGGTTPTLSSGWTPQVGTGTPTTSAGNTDAFTVDTSGNVVFAGTLTGPDLFITPSKLKLRAPSDTFEIRGSNSDFNIYTDVITGNAVWVDLPITGPSAIGSGGIGNNAWIGYASAAGYWFSNSSTGDICYRNTIGNLLFGNGTGTADMALHNSMLGIGTVTPSQSLDVIGNILIESTGKLMITGGTNGTLNTIALSSGTVTVSNTSIATGDLVYIQYASGTALNIGIGNISTMFVVPTITSGTSFVINALTVTGSVNVTDNSTVQYFIIHKN